jgi:hypothetical protein
MKMMTATLCRDARIRSGCKVLNVTAHRPVPYSPRGGRLANDPVSDPTKLQVRNQTSPTMSSIARAASRQCRIAAVATQAAPAQPPIHSPVRMLHGTLAPQAPYKNSQDRETLDPRRPENTQSGRDDDVAQKPAAAFDPRKTRPETSYRAAERASSADGEDGSNPLQASGANQELSKPMGDEKSTQGTGPGEETRKGGASRRQSAPKKGDASKLGGK